MSRLTLCPDPARLRQLLAGKLPEGEQAELTEHLDHCDHCQQRLEQLAAGSGSWPESARHIGGAKPGPDSAYWLALRNLQAGPTRIQPTTPPPAPARELALDFLIPSEDPTHLGRLDSFEIVEVLGRGGMGVVLKAFDNCLQRYVAIKVLDPQTTNNPTARQRFCREARAAAAVRHENVVAIHSVDKVADIPYLVMEYIPGLSLQDRLDQGPRLELADVVRIGMQTAAGLAAAHRQGLIHRDVKPANILLEEGGQRVKITDFGLARANEDVRLTQSGVVAGTPQYMSPEQANGHTPDHRSDLFSLGSVLYAMCTGQAPFVASSAVAMLLSITQDTPRPIKEANPEVPDWLVEIITTLHAKNPADRFQSAEAVAELLGEFLAHLRQPSRVALPCLRSRRAAQVRRRRLLLAGAAALLLLTGFVVTEITGFTHATVSLAGLLQGQHEEPTTPARLTLSGTSGPIWSVAFSPDGRTLAAALDTGIVKLWDSRTGRIKATITAHKQFPIWSVAYSPDGRLLATGSDDGTAKVWDARSGAEKFELKHVGSVRPLAFGGKSRKLVTGTRNGAVLIWDLSGKQPRSLATAGHTGVVMAVALSADGKLLASASGDGTVKLWNAETGQLQVTLQEHGGGVWGVAISPDGSKVATGGWDHNVRLWEAATGNLLIVLKGHSHDIWGVAFSPDGQTLASASGDRTVKLWDVASGKERLTFTGHTSTVYSVAFSPDGKTVAAGGRAGTVKLWDVDVGK